MASLKLKMSDLLPFDLPPLKNSSVQDLFIFIPLNKLVQLLDETEAEAPQSVKSNKRKTSTTFRKRKRTFSEKLFKRREKMYAKQKMTELTKNVAVDEKYVNTIRLVRRRKSIRNQQRVVESVENLTVRVGERDFETNTEDAN